MLPSPSRPKPGKGLRCHLAGLLFGTLVLFIVTTVAVIAAHKQLVSLERAAGLLQSAELEVEQLAYIAVSGHHGGTFTLIVYISSRHQSGASAGAQQSRLHDVCIPCVQRWKLNAEFITHYSSTISVEQKAFQCAYERTGLCTVTCATTERTRNKRE